VTPIGAKVKAWGALDDLLSALRKANRKSVAAANLVRQDLGLPSVPL
jgi:hypothetical protein